MPLSRLDNFLKNVRGNIIYVNPNDLDATDSATNQGNSMGRLLLLFRGHWLKELDFLIRRD